MKSLLGFFSLRTLDHTYENHNKTFTKLVILMNTIIKFRIKLVIILIIYHNQAKNQANSNSHDNAHVKCSYQSL